jgi:hypothetical protein
MTQGPPVAGVQVFFRSIDVDDPTTDDKDLDDEKQEKDNHGRPPEGILRQDVEFEVTMQPGDNFRVVASCVSRTEIAGNRVKAKQDDGDARVVDANGNVIKDDTTTAAARKARPVLTVWRVLHVEADTMDSPPTSDRDPERNFIKGFSLSLLPPMRSPVTSLS